MGIPYFSDIKNLSAVSLTTNVSCWRTILFIMSNNQIARRSNARQQYKYSTYALINLALDLVLLSQYDAYVHRKRSPFVYNQWIDVNRFYLLVFRHHPSNRLDRSRC